MLQFRVHKAHTWVCLAPCRWFSAKQVLILLMWLMPQVSRSTSKVHSILPAQPCLHDTHTHKLQSVEQEGERYAAAASRWQKWACSHTIQNTLILNPVEVVINFQITLSTGTSSVTLYAGAGGLCGGGVVWFNQTILHPSPSVHGRRECMCAAEHASKMHHRLVCFF